MLLSNRAIIDHMQKGNIVIDPFTPENLKTVSYDLTIGEYFWREASPNPEKFHYNPYDEQDVRSIWKLCKAPNEDSNRVGIEGFRAIWLRPHETILAHTQEFIGGRNIVTTMMKARSSIGRNFIEVCKCAGWGDVGYINRWTMEITNNSNSYQIPLIVGSRVAQMAFFEVAPPIGSYDGTKYQTTTVIEELKKRWSPEDMLPKMWKDLPLPKSV